jgi:GNAT superfamily N-acetyltransferase
MGQIKIDLSEMIIAPFRSQDQDEAGNLILQGLGEHWGFIDYTKNPDLDDIATTYANATFLVARLDGRLIGTGAFVTPSIGVAQIVRMSVAQDLRGCGIGTLILRQLYERAKSAGYRKMILETTETWDDVIRFYRKFGFQITHYQAGDVYFVLNLDQ